MFELLAKGSRGSDEQSLRKFESLLNVWADIALRTLVFAKREIEDFESWNVRWTAANESAEEVRAPNSPLRALRDLSWLAGPQAEAGGAQPDQRVDAGAGA